MDEVNFDKILADRRRSGVFAFVTDGQRQKAHASWYRGEQCNFNPTHDNFQQPGAIENYILKGWLPAGPFISKTNKITAFGSCFAVHISDYLVRRGYDVLTKGNANAYIIRCGEGMVNTFALLQQFEWAFEGKAFSQGLWHGYDAEECAYDEVIRQATLDIFQRTECFVITLGLSEVWYDKKSDEVFWRAIPQRVFDPDRHGFRVTTHEENRTNIERIYKIVRAHRPDAHLLFTLSPIPLVATFRPQGCVSANSVSKAILRAATDEVMRSHADDGNLHYFPAYEIVTEAFVNRFEEDRRHVKREIVDFVVACFERFFCVGGDEQTKSLYYAKLAIAHEAAGNIAAAALAREMATSAE